jgi:hypothetical protein
MMVEERIDLIERNTLESILRGQEHGIEREKPGNSLYHADTRELSKKRLSLWFGTTLQNQMQPTGTNIITPKGRGPIRRPSATGPQSVVLFLGIQKGNVIEHGILGKTGKGSNGSIEVTFSQKVEQDREGGMDKRTGRHDVEGTRRKMVTG